MWKVRHVDGTPLVIGKRSLNLIHRPQIEPGMQLTHEGLPSLVLADLGAVVRLRFTRERLLSGWVNIVFDGVEGEVNKATLVAENLSTLLKQHTQEAS
jgi:hypothetical protein